MSYCTPADVRVVIPLVDEQAMSDTDMQVFITKAENLVNAKLRDTYLVPFDPVPSIVTDVTAEYAAYLVYRTLFSQNSPNSSDYVKDLYDSAEKMLREISNGVLELDAEKQSLSIQSTTDGQKKVFSMEDITPYGFKQF